LACGAALLLVMLAEAGYSQVSATGIRGAITGRVYDSLAMRPLSGAAVQLAAIGAGNRLEHVKSVLAEADGSYRFAELRAGAYLLGFQHFALDTLGLTTPLKLVELRSSATIRVDLAIPSAASLVSYYCGPPAAQDSLALLRGMLRSARDGSPLPGAFLSLRWAELYLSGSGMERTTPIVDVYADSSGWFLACVPGGVPLLARASYELLTSGDVELALPATAVLRRDIYVGRALATVAAPSDSGTPGPERIVNRGSGSVRGRVLGSDARPIAGARVALLAGVGEVRTDSRGAFRLTEVPEGTQMIEARALGYLPAQEVVDVVAFREPVVDFYLVDLRAVALDTVRVAAVRHLEASARAGFERRRRAGAGYFLDESQIDTMRVFAFRDIVRGIPGIRFVRGTRSDDTWREHIEFSFGGRSAPCLPSIYLDGALLLPGKIDLDVIIHPSTVRRVEVYHRGTSIPAEFASASQCGVLAVWTGPRRQPVPRE
jgi:hypothetical protein